MFQSKNQHDLRDEYPRRGGRRRTARRDRGGGQRQGEGASVARATGEGGGIAWEGAGSWEIIGGGGGDEDAGGQHDGIAGKSSAAGWNRGERSSREDGVRRGRGRDRGGGGRIAAPARGWRATGLGDRTEGFPIGPIDRIPRTAEPPRGGG